MCRWVKGLNDRVCSRSQAVVGRVPFVNGVVLRKVNIKGNGQRVNYVFVMAKYIIIREGHSMCDREIKGYRNI